MSKKKKAKKTNTKNVQKVLEQQPEKNNTLVFGGDSTCNEFYRSFDFCT